jgi:UDP-N-acetylglucosamine 2-epimerase (non-hydrolysing)
MKISVIFGTRPEAIKLAPIIIELKKHPDIIFDVCVTAQHRQMLDQVLEVFKIVPDTDLNLMTSNQSLADFTSRAILELDQYLEKEKPDLVLVQGDTTTVFCASLVAFYHKIPIGHVEAGLRTGNMLSPWPEEANRVLTSRLARLHFAPTEINKTNLLNEGIEESKVFVTGNTVIDALLMAVEEIKKNPPKIEGLPGQGLGFIGTGKYILLTGHRRENLGDGLKNICYSITELTRIYSDLHFIYPVHLNPKVQETVYHLLGDQSTNKRIHLIPPQTYLAFVFLMYNSYFIITDSGGIQEEAPSLGKPVLILRDTTERPEGVACGVTKLVGSDKNMIVHAVSHLLNDKNEYKLMSQSKNPYGDGIAGKRITEIIIKHLMQ